MILCKAPAFLACLLLCFAQTAYAFQEAGLDELKSIRSLKCRFLLMQTVKWDGVKPKMETAQEELVLHFDSIDQKNGTARMIGNEGAEDVMLIGRPVNITVIEKTGFGNFTFTTIYADYRNDEFIAVHSRHMDLPNGPRSSQFHGTCKVWGKQ